MIVDQPFVPCLVDLALWAVTSRQRLEFRTLLFAHNRSTVIYAQ